MKENREPNRFEKFLNLCGIDVSQYGGRLSGQVIRAIKKDLIENHEDFVDLEKFDYSLNEALEKYPSGLPLRLIAKGLMISEDEAEGKVEEIVEKMRAKMGVNEV